MSRTTASQQAADAAVVDDEGQSLSVGTSTTSSRQTSRWRTQLFALQCLHSICTVVGRSGRREHLDIAFARSQGIPTHGLLVSRVPDLIKIAFTASAAHVTEIRLEGLTVLTDVIKVRNPRSCIMNAEMNTPRYRSSPRSSTPTAKGTYCWNNIRP